MRVRSLALAALLVFPLSRAFGVRQDAGEDDVHLAITNTDISRVLNAEDLNDLSGQSVQPLIPQSIAPLPDDALGSHLLPALRELSRHGRIGLLAPRRSAPASPLFALAKKNPRYVYGVPTVEGRSRLVPVFALADLGQLNRLIALDGVGAGYSRLLSLMDGAQARYEKLYDDDGELPLAGLLDQAPDSLRGSSARLAALHAAGQDTLPAAHAVRLGLLRAFKDQGYAPPDVSLEGMDADLPLYLRLLSLPNVHRLKEINEPNFRLIEAQAFWDLWRQWGASSLAELNLEQLSRGLRVDQLTPGQRNALEGLRKLKNRGVAHLSEAVGDLLNEARQARFPR